MRMSGSNRRKERKPRRFVARRQSPCLAASPDGTAQPGPEAHHSGPGLLFSASQTEVVRTVLNWAAPWRGVSSYFIPPEQKIPLATNKDLGKFIDEGKFRPDLFYRLDVFRIELPPLRAPRGYPSASGSLRSQVLSGHE